MNQQDFDLAGIDIVINTHLHFDHCGGRTIYLQRLELDEPHTEGQLQVWALDPKLVWLTHEHEPWRPHREA